MKQDIDNIIELICLEDPRYHGDAYEFVLEALGFSQKKFTRSKHVTGKQLLEGVKELVMRRFGLMGRPVLKHWGINGTADVGNIVFNLINKKILTKNEEDCLDDFKDVFDFERVFDSIYRERMNKQISQLR